MEHGRFVRGEPNSRDHVTELRDRGIGEDSLDVRLLRREQRAKKRSDRSGPRDNEQRCLRRLNQKRHPNEQINSSRDHRRGVNQGRDRRWTLHRVGQPNMQRELRGFADRAAEDQNRGDCEVIGIARDL